MPDGRMDVAPVGAHPFGFLRLLPFAGHVRGADVRLKDGTGPPAPGTFVAPPVGGNDSVKILAEILKRQAVPDAASNGFLKIREKLVFRRPGDHKALAVRGPYEIGIGAGGDADFALKEINRLLEGRPLEFDLGAFFRISHWKPCRKDWPPIRHPRELRQVPPYP